MLASNAGLARKLNALEKKYDEQFKVVFDAIRELMTPPAHMRKGKIGFRREQEISNFVIINHGLGVVFS